MVGHDLRTYSARLKDRFVEGLVAAGRDVVDVGCVLTPTLYFSQIHLGVPAGAMITASHNPQGWSGMKLATEPVTTLGSEDIRRLHAIADGGALASGKGSARAHDVKPASR